MNNLKECKMVPITELLECIVDNRGKSCPTCEEGFPLIATNCIKHSSIYPTFENIRYVSDETLKTWFRAELKPNDILFVNKGTPGRVCLVPDPITFCAAQDMIGLRADSKKIYYKYLFAVLRSSFIQEKIANFHVGIAIPHFKKSDMDNLLIPVPDMDIQKKIGDIYCELSEKIENNNKINTELESMAKTIYDYWFLQFEFPNEDGKPYKSSGGKMVWNEELKREIPEGWEVGQLNKLGDLLMGQSPKSESYNDNEIGYPLINGAAELQANKIEITKYTSEPTRVCKINDLLFCIRATIGNLRYSEAEYCLGRGVAAFTPKKSEYAEYAFDLLNNILEIYKKILTGSIIVGITKDDLSEKLIVIPNEAVIKKYSLILKPVHDKIRKNQKENQELASLRDFLLPMLMNGQVGFKDGEK